MSCLAKFGASYPQELHHRRSSMPSIVNHPAKIAYGDSWAHEQSASPDPNTQYQRGHLCGCAPTRRTTGWTTGQIITPTRFDVGQQDSCWRAGPAGRAHRHHREGEEPPSRPPLGAWR